MGEYASPTKTMKKPSTIQWNVQSNPGLVVAKRTPTPWKVAGKPCFLRFFIVGLLLCCLLVMQFGNSALQALAGWCHENSVTSVDPVNGAVSGCFSYSYKHDFAPNISSIFCVTFFEQPRNSEPILYRLLRVAPHVGFCFRPWNGWESGKMRITQEYMVSCWQSFCFPLHIIFNIQLQSQNSIFIVKCCTLESDSLAAFACLETSLVSVHFTMQLMAQSALLDPRWRAAQLVACRVQA